MSMTEPATWTQDRIIAQLRADIAAGAMTQAGWDRLTPATRELVRDNSALSPQLIGLEGWRVAVIDNKGDAPSAVRRFIVGKSTGWRPCHLELVRKNAHGGGPAAMAYWQVIPLERVR